MSRAAWSTAIRSDIRDVLAEVLAIPCACEDQRCHRCTAALNLAVMLGFQSPQAWAIVTGDTSVAALELSRLRMEYAAALQREMETRPKPLRAPALIDMGRCACGQIALDGKECSECWFQRITHEEELRRDAGGLNRMAASDEGQARKAARP